MLKNPYKTNSPRSIVSDLSIYKFLPLIGNSFSMD